MKKLLSILFICTIGLSTYAADDVEFKASAPAQVIMGRPFQLTYSVNQRAKDLRAPEFADFDYIAGPYTSQSSSTTFVNGKRTSSFNLTYTYTLVANKEGSFTIPAATIKVDGEQYTSNGVRIKVLPADQPDTRSNTQSQNSTSNPNNSSSSSASSENIFMRTLVSKTHVHEQEAIQLTYKLYFAGVDIAQLTNNTQLPEFKGFLKQELELGEIQTELEHYNGRNYQTAVLYRTILFPQRSGDIVIDPAQFEALVRVQNRAQVRSIFDDFFNSYTTVTKQLKSPGVTIHVAALPAKPTAFGGGVGQFSLSSNISSTETQANEAITLTLTLQGSGNMKLLKTPYVDWPEGFEVYDPKISNNFKVTTSGVSGSKTIEYLAIPRASGTYTIPPVQFAYYDTQSDTYKTLTTQEYTINITRGNNEESNATVVNNYVNKETVQQFGNDIRYIYTGELATEKSNKEIIRFGSLLFWLCYIIPSFLAALLFIIFRKQIKENADITRVRYKKANKVAQQRLKKAATLLKENKKEAFYEEIERAAWTYLSDRLSIPTAQLNKDNIAQILTSKGISNELIEEVRRVLSTAEFARYAPISDHTMQDLYTDTTQIINQLENAKL